MSRRKVKMETVAEEQANIDRHLKSITNPVVEDPQPMEMSLIQWFANQMAGKLGIAAPDLDKPKCNEEETKVIELKTKRGAKQ